jgi:hypothetical protein
VSSGREKERLPSTDDDLVVPTRNGTERTRQEAPKALRLDREW